MLLDEASFVVPDVALVVESKDSTTKSILFLFNFFFFSPPLTSQVVELLTLFYLVVSSIS